MLSLVQYKKCNVMLDETLQILNNVISKPTCPLIIKFNSVLKYKFFLKGFYSHVFNECQT